VALTTEILNKFLLVDSTFISSSLHLDRFFCHGVASLDCEATTGLRVRQFGETTVSINTKY
jgi:hypothetical protein